MRTLLGTLAVAAYLGLTAPAYAQQNEWQIGTAPVVNPAPVTEEKAALHFQGVDQFLDYTTFLAERIQEVREINKSYTSDPIVNQIIGLERDIANIRSATKTLKGLKWSFEVDETDQLDKFLGKYRERRDAAEDQKREARRVKSPVKVNHTLLTCEDSQDYSERLDQVNQEYNSARIQAIRTDVEITKNGTVIELEDQLSNLLRTTRAQAQKFNLEHKCGGI
ncbi:MAG: hypothetical protein WCV90_01360 [Candidatus Woesearchaeota archaeon]